MPDRAQVVVTLRVNPLAQRQQQGIGFFGAAQLGQVRRHRAGDAHLLFVGADALGQRQAGLAHRQRLLHAPALAQQVGVHADGAQALRVAAGLRQQGRGFAQRVLVDGRRSQRIHARGQRLEAAFGVAGQGPLCRGVAVQRSLFVAARRLQRALGSLLEGSGGLGGIAGLRPVARDARRLAAMRGQPRGALRMHAPRHHLRHAAQHGVTHQIVREAFVAQHLRVLQFAPGTGELDRAHTDRRFCEFDAEIHAGNRRHPCQRESRLAQALQAALDQATHAQRARQLATRQAAVGQALLERLQHEHRIAAGVAPQRRGQRAALQAVDGEPIDERSDRAFVEPGQRDDAQAQQLGERAAQRLRCGGQLGRACGQEPAPGRVGRRHQAGDQFERGLVREVQIVERHHRHGALQQQGRHRGGHRAWAQCGQCSCGSGSDDGCNVGQRVACARVQARAAIAHAIQQGPKQAGQRGIGRARVAGTAGRRERRAFARQQFGHQPALAQAGLAFEQHGAALGPVLQRGGAFRLAPREQRWPLQRDRQGLVRGARFQGRVRALMLLPVGPQDRSQLFARGGRVRTVVGSKHVAQAPVGGQAGSVVAAQVVQPHQLAVMALDLTVEPEQGVGGGQGGIEIAGRFAIGQLLAQGRQPTFAPGLALQVEPGRKVLAVAVVVRAQQGRARGLAIGLGHQVRCQSQGVVADQQLALEGLPKTQQLLAQIAPRVARIGPQQRGHAQPADTGLQRGQRQQRGGAALECHAGACGRHDGRVAVQANTPLGGWGTISHDRMIAHACGPGHRVKRQVQ